MNYEEWHGHRPPSVWRWVLVILLALVLLGALALTVYAILDGQDTIPWWDSPLTK